MKFSIRAVLWLMTIVALFLAFETRAIRQHNEAAARLRDRGGQFEFAPMTLIHWMTRTTPRIEELKFFGPQVDDEAVNDIVQVANRFASKRISLIETLVSPSGERELKMRLPDVQFQIVTLGIGSPMMRMREQRR